MKNVVFAAVAALAIGIVAWMLWSTPDIDDIAPKPTTWDESAFEPDDEPESIDAATAEMAESDSGDERAAVAAGDQPPSTQIQLTIRGRVVTSAGQPVADADVRFQVSRGRWGRRSRGGSTRIRQSTTSASDGSFEFAGPGPSQSRMQLLVQHERYAPLLDDRQITDSGELDLGDLVLLDGGTITGRVVDEQQNGIADAVVELDPAAGNRIAWSTFRDRLEIELTTDAAGGYRAEGLMPGNYRISAAARGRQRGYLRSPVRAKDANEQQVKDIVLRDGFVLTGTVYAPDGEPVEGAQIRVNGTRMRGDRTRTDAAGEFELEHVAQQVFELRVEASGYLTWLQTGIDPATTRNLVVRLEAGLTLEGRVVDAATGAAVSEYSAKADRIRGIGRSSTGGSGDSASALEALRRRLAESNNSRERATNAAELQARIARLSQRTEALRQRREIDRARLNRRHRKPSDLGPIETRPDGAFRFEGLDEGVYVVYIGSPGHEITSTEEIELRRESPPTQQLITVQRGLFVRGTVIRAGDDSPVAQARVELMAVRPEPERNRSRADNPMARLLRNRQQRGDQVMSVQTDANGQFEFAHAPAGRYFLSTNLRGFSTHRTEPFELSADRDRMDVVLEPAAIVRGTVSGVSRDRMSEVRVVAFAGPGRGRMRESRPTDDGSYEIDNVQPGNYLLRAFIGELGTFATAQLRRLQEDDLQHDLVVAPGGVYEFDLVVNITPVGAVRGRVLQNGDPSVNARVSLRDPPRDGAPSRRRYSRRLSARTDSNGEFELEKVPAGEYQLVVHGIGRNSRTEVYNQPLTITGDATAEVMVRYETGTLSGTVTVSDDSDANSLRGSLYVFPGVFEAPDKPHQFARSNKSHRLRVTNGTFESSDVTVGPALVVLQLGGREDSTQQIVVGPGETQLTIAAGAKQPN